MTRIVNVLALMIALSSCSGTTENQPGPAATSTSTSSPGPVGVPVAPNASLITARVISAAKQETGTFVELEVIESQPIPDYLDFGANIVGEQITARLVDESTDLSTLVGQMITGQLRYEGDERGGIYLLSEVSAK